MSTTWDDVKKLIGTAAPSLLPIIGSIVAPGPGTVIGGLAGKAIQCVLGTAEVDKLTEIAATDPDIALKLREVEVTFQLESKKIDFDKLKLEKDVLALQLLDMQSARNREEQIIKAIGVDKDKRFLTFAGVIAPLVFLAFIIKWGLPQMSPEISLLVGNLIGLMFAKYATIFDYHMGTSVGMEKSNTSYNVARAIDKMIERHNGVGGEKK